MTTLVEGHGKASLTFQPPLQTKSRDKAPSLAAQYVAFRLAIPGLLGDFLAEMHSGMCQAALGPRFRCSSWLLGSPQTRRVPRAHLRHERRRPCPSSPASPGSRGRASWRRQKLGIGHRSATRRAANRVVELVGRACPGSTYSQRSRVRRSTAICKALHRANPSSLGWVEHPNFLSQKLQHGWAGFRWLHELCPVP